MRTLITSVFFAISFSITAQNLDSLFIYKSVDEMTDATYYFLSRKLVCLNEAEDIGFSVSAFVEGKSDSSLQVEDFHIIAAGFSCVEGVEVIFLFDDGSKITGRGWNKFNCDGDVYLTLSKIDKQTLMSKKVSKIRVTNGRNYKSYTAEIPENNQDFFIQLGLALKNAKVQRSK